MLAKIKSFLKDLKKEWSKEPSSRMEKYLLPEVRSVGYYCRLLNSLQEPWSWEYELLRDLASIQPVLYVMGNEIQHPTRLLSYFKADTDLSTEQLRKILGNIYAVTASEYLDMHYEDYSIKSYLEERKINPDYVIISYDAMSIESEYYVLKNPDYFCS